MSSCRAHVREIQFLTLFVAGESDSAYLKLGMALRLALHAKLHLEPPSHLHPVAKEERRRVFWAIYLQDKLISLSWERFPMLPDYECRLQLPCSEVGFSDGIDETAPVLEDFSGNYWDQEVTNSCSTLAMQMVMVSTLSRVSQYVLNDYKHSDQDIPWLSGSSYSAIVSRLLQMELRFGMSESLVDRLGRIPGAKGGADERITGPIIYSQALYHLSYCLLHHPFLLQRRLQKLHQHVPQNFLSNSWETCRAHAKSLALFKGLREKNLLVMTALYGYCFMIAGTIQIISLHDKSCVFGNEDEEHLRACLHLLGELSRYWKHAGLMVSVYDMFDHEFQISFTCTILSTLAI